MNFEIVTVNGKQWAFFTGPGAKKITKLMRFYAGGLRYSWNGGIIFQAIGAYGDLNGFYQRLVEKVME